MQIKIVDNSDMVIKDMDAAVVRALERCGLAAEGYAKKLCPVDTGNLRNSITHKVNESEPAAYIGTNVDYAIYVEIGTYKMKAQPYLKPAVTDHAETYKNIIIDEMKSN